MASGRRIDPRRLDVRSFAAEGATLDGEWALGDLARLASAVEPGSIGDAPPIAWHVLGARARLDGAGASDALVVAARAVLSMQCQRCLQPVEVPLHVDRRFFFVEGEDSAAALDLEADDDVLALQPAFDLRALIEDELLLSLPLIPRHEVCPEPLPLALLDEDEEAAKVLPFAGLAALRKRSAPRS